MHHFWTFLYGYWGAVKGSGEEPTAQEIQNEDVPVVRSGTIKSTSRHTETAQSWSTSAEVGYGCNLVVVPRKRRGREKPEKEIDE